MQSENPDVSFIGVAALDTAQEMERFVGYTGTGAFPHINDENGAVWASYGIGYQPAFVLISAQGLSETWGSLSGDELQERIDFLFF